MTKYSVVLSPKERKSLKSIVDDSDSDYWRAVRSAVLLLRYDGYTYAQVARQLGISTVTVWHTCKAWDERGMASIERRGGVQAGRKHLGPAVRSLLASILQEPPPKGRYCWSLRALAKELQSRGAVDSISHEWVRVLLNEEGLSLHA